MFLDDAINLALGEQWGVADCQSLPEHKIVFAVLENLRKRQSLEILASGKLFLCDEKFGLLRLSAFDFKTGPYDVYVAGAQIKKFRLNYWDIIEGEVRPPKANEEFMSMLRIHSVNGVAAEEALKIIAASVIASDQAA